AQAVLGPGDDALVLPRGVLRVRVLTSWTRFDERYGLNTPNRKAGSIEPLGVDFSRDTLGVQQFEVLVPLRDGLRSLSGLANSEVSLGHSVLGLAASVTTIPFVADVGVTSRLAVGLLVPVVRTRMEAVFSMNPQGREGNLGINPAFDDPTGANSELVRQFRAAAAALTDRRAFCQANPGEPGCAELNANGAAADTLIAQASAFADGLAEIYSDMGSVFVPVTNTELDVAIKSRIAVFGTGFSSFGVPTTFVGLVGAPNPLTSADAQRVLTEPAFGIAAAPLETISRIGVGDIEIAGKLQWLNSLPRDQRFTASGFNVRSAVTALVRLGTGRPDSPDNFIDLGTGDGQTDVELRSQSDLVFGRRTWMTVVGRYAWQLRDHEVRRITAPDQPLAAAYRRQRVERDLGDYFELDVLPRFVLNDYVAVGGEYLYRHKSQDSYSGTFNVTNTLGEPITLDASILNAETRQREQRVGGGIAFSTVAAHRRGRASLPLEITYQYVRSVTGSGGRTPKVSQHIIQLRAYLPLFARDRRR
ncbi:MAG: hypothetical protein M3336_00050, partial [Chloroflexota bacterium]|nr:hypothetical protein [Chloroflexota bacterium]